MVETFENTQIFSRPAFAYCWRFTIVAVFVLTLSVLLLACKPQDSAERGTQGLVLAFKNRRLIEPRLSGGFKGGQFDPQRDNRSNLDVEQLERARALILDGVVGEEPAAIQAYVRLLLSEGEKLSIAAKHLRRLIEGGLDLAETRNDLGVCLFQQGKLEEALDEFNIALNRTPQMREAVFNRALCFEKLQLQEPAVSGFAELARIERDESWLTEIKDRRARLAQPLVGLSYDAVGESLDVAFQAGRIDELRLAVSQRLELVWHYSLGVLVKRYLKAAVEKDRAKADSTFNELTVLGEAIDEIHGDPSVSEVARYLKSLPENDLTKELGLVDECLTNPNKQGETRETYRRLYEEFRARKNVVFQTLSRWYPARQLYVTSSYSESLKELQSLMLVLKPNWPTLRLLVMSQIGLALSRLGQDSLAISYFNESLALSRRLNTLIGRALQNLSLPYWHIGDFDRAFSYLRDSMTQSILEGREASSLAYDYLQIADLYRLRERPDLAVLYAKESLKLATEAKHARFASQASSLMAVEYSNLSKLQEAEENLATAFEWLKQLDVATANSYSRPLVLTRAATVSVRSGDIARALQYYDEAEELVSTAQERKLPLVRVLRGRADALIAAGRAVDAKANLERAVEILEGYRAEIASSEDRSYFLETSNAVFDLLLTLNLEQAGGEEVAFELSERSRARALLEDISSHSAQQGAGNAKTAKGAPSRNGSNKPVKVTDIQQQLPPDLLLVEYSVTDRGTFIFVLNKSGLRVVRSSATSSSLEQLVNGYLSNLDNRDAVNDPVSRSKLSESARMLYDQLINPIRELIRGETRLCIVPDKSLHFLPFAGLEDSDGGYLVQQFSLNYAPSASVLSQCIEQSIKRRQSGPEKLFAVGNPDFDKNYFNELKDLQESEAEALDSAKLYAHPETLTGSDATKARVLSGLSDCDVVHLASHCLINNSSPWRAALVLASSKSNKAGASNGSAGASANAEANPAEAHLNELLSLEEIYQVRLPRTKLAVLSACQTGLGRYFRGEGVVSLVRPFIASGVPTVVASLWSVDSASTYELMVRFHRERTTNGRGPSDALRAAQINMLSGEFQHPYYWAAFIAVGK